jgi:hypothetical protein
MALLVTAAACVLATCWSGCPGLQGCCACHQNCLQNLCTAEISAHSEIIAFARCINTPTAVAQTITVSMEQLVS